MLLCNLSEVYKKGLLIMSVLYNRIAGLCEMQKITITTMCKESGASRASLSDLKVGRKQSLSAETLDKIADYFDTTVDYLLGRTEDPENDDRFGLSISDDEMIEIEQKEKAPTPEGERSADPDIRRIERARKNMSEKDKKKMMELLELSFEDYFSDDFQDDDLDE